MSMTNHGRRTRRALAFVALASGFTLASSAVAGATAVAESLVAGTGDAFFRTSFVEVGARPNGSFGSDAQVPDATWHNNDADNTGLLGFRADREGNGWGVGIDDGDFFVPGTPFEGFSLSVEGVASYHNNHSDDQITGAFSNATTSPTPRVTWASSADSSNIALSQVYSIPSASSLAVDITVTLTNHGGSSAEVYYQRAVDPDNCHNQPAASCTGFYETTNTIEGQKLDGSEHSRVSATADDGSWMALTTDDAESMVWAADSGNGCAFASEPDQVYTEPRTYVPGSPLTDLSGCTYFNQVNAAQSDDYNIGLIIHRTIAAGASTTFTLRYLLGLVSELPSTGVNSMPSIATAVVLMGMGSAILVTQRRRVRPVR